MKRIVAIAAVLLTVLCSACGKTTKEKTFTVEEMKLTLDDSFKEDTYEGYTKIFLSKTKEAGVYALREDKSLLGGRKITLDEYVDLIRSSNEAKGLNIEETSEHHGIPYLEHNYVNSDSKVTYRYLTAMYESEKAFWFVQFVCEKNKYNTYRNDFLSWAQSVNFE